jgi:beta-lactam-binding protein with PASTA domain
VAATTTSHQQAPRVVVPKLVGEHYRVAVRRLHQRGLTAHAPGFTGSYSSTGMNGCETILNQAPAPGSNVEPHTSVAIVIGLAHC